ncbi:MULTISPECIES: potassium transporter Trk [unclassified Microbacterium]|uniref:potassium transporter Trk n=1 Tax=unclassified Microbacterium TaxID=2609290 RepID=UPI000D509901|nr:potassium transporter Trk [Microbacterium sp. TPD7012]PVE96640.1 potassium transporter Trk [Microbacterium sp. TPD7012]
MAPTDSHQTVEATVRRVPRYGVLMGIGVVVGIIAAAILTWSGSFEESQALDVVYPPGQVFGFLLLWTVPIGLALGGVVGIIMERIARRHDRVVTVDRETVVETDRPAAD